MLAAGAAAGTVREGVLREPHPAPGALLHGMVWQCASGLAAVLASLLVVTAAMFAFIRWYEDRARRKVAMPARAEAADVALPAAVAGPAPAPGHEALLRRLR